MTERDDVFDKRYGEVLLVTAGETGPEASVYNSFPLNDCPAELWDKLDADAIAKENGAIAALLNGPRHWLSSMNPAPYSVNHVDRKAVFNFDAGRPVFELVDAQGQRWVMQTYSQVVDPHLTLAGLPGLAARLTLPEGWRYETRILTERLRVDTTTRDAHVTQDSFANSYSLEF
jgi:hypothetical protein